mgnify:FL=1
MTDVVSAAVRSRMMAGIKGRNTRPELLITSLLHKRGFRFRLHDRALPGKPDLVFRKYKAVIFIQGCFWHGHKCHLFKWPATREKFWRTKIGINKKNDRKNHEQLMKRGWRVLDIWECALKGVGRRTTENIAMLVTGYLKSGARYQEIKGILEKPERNRA